MEQRRNRRQRVGVIMVLMGLLTSLAAILAPTPATAVTVVGGTIGGFEVDGNQVEESGVTGTLDWDLVKSTAQRYDDTSPTDPGFVGSSKENDPTQFSCNGDGGDDPGKADLLRAYVNSRITSDTSAFLDLGFVRRSKEGDGGTVSGDSHVNFEFNRGEITGACPYGGRQTGDLLLTFDFPGNGSDPAVVKAFTWDASIVEGGSSDVGAWVEFTVPADSVKAQDNAASITDTFTGDVLDTRTFGEASIDLIKLDDATEGDLLTCPGFGTVSIRSRSSGESFQSALQDYIGPEEVDLSTCGDIALHKTDDSDPAQDLPGAVFGLWPLTDPSSVPAVGSVGTRDGSAAIAICEGDETDADGICFFDEVTPGDYEVAEISAPPGYAIDPHVEAVTIGFRDTGRVIEYEWVDPLHTGSVIIIKRLFDDANDNGERDEGEEIVQPDDPSDLDGIKFELQQGDPGVTSTTHPGGDPAECTIANGEMQCEIGPVPLGTYDVKETLGANTPSDIGLGDPPSPVTIDEDGETVTVNYDDPVAPPPPPPPPPPGPIDIDLDKTGDVLAHVGDTVDYEFTVTNTGDVALVDVDLTDPECNAGTITLVDDGDGNTTLAVDEVWTYTCQRTITADDVVVVDGEDFAFNLGTVTARDSNGRQTDDTDPHEVEIITPSIEVVKTVDDDTPEVGQTVTFTYVVTNTGDTALFDVDVEDDQLGAIGTIDVLEPGESATLTKTMVVATDSPTRNVATADGEDILGEQVEDDDDATITIVQGVVILPPAQPLPVTGAGLDRLLPLAAMLLLLGGALTLSGPVAARVRRHRQ